MMSADCTLCLYLKWLPRKKCFSYSFCFRYCSKDSNHVSYFTRLSVKLFNFLSSYSVEYHCYFSY